MCNIPSTFRIRPYRPPLIWAWFKPSFSFICYHFTSLSCCSYICTISMNDWVDKALLYITGHVLLSPCEAGKAVSIQCHGHILFILYSKDCVLVRPILPKGLCCSVDTKATKYIHNVNWRHLVCVTLHWTHSIHIAYINNTGNRQEKNLHRREGCTTVYFECCQF